VTETLSIDSLKAAINAKKKATAPSDQDKFEAKARRFEQAVQHFNQQVQKVVSQIPALNVTLEDETETFTSPAYPGYSKEVRDQRLKIAMEEDFLLFDPTGQSFSTSFGQIHIEASRPIPILIERILYLMESRADPSRFYWGYRSIEDFGQKICPFDQAALLKILHSVFAGGD
jgi:hypothetical protein